MRIGRHGSGEEIDSLHRREVRTGRSLRFLTAAVFSVGVLIDCPSPPSNTPPPATIVYDFITGPEYDGRGVCSDGSGNSYVAGTSSQSFDGETNHGGTDAVLIKYDSPGNRVWTKLIGGSGDENGNAVAFDPNGAVYVAGTTNTSDLTFDNQANIGGKDAFVAKYDVDGNFQWTVFVGGTADDFGTGVAADGAGNIYIVGYTYSSFGSQTNAGNTDGFIAQLDSSGNPGWTHFVGAAAFETIRAIAFHGPTALYCAGSASGSIDGEINNGNNDVLITKFDTSGNQPWTKLAGGTLDDSANGIAADSTGLYAAGTTLSTSFNGQTNAGGTDAFIIKYDPDGNPLWTRFSGGSGIENGYASALDSSGNCYVAGSTTSSFNGKTNAGGSDAFVTGWDADGNHGTTTFYGGALNDYAYGIGFGWSTVYMTGTVDSVS